MQMRRGVTAAAARLFYTHRLFLERKKGAWLKPGLVQERRRSPPLLPAPPLSLSLSAACVILPFIDLCVCVRARQELTHLLHHISSGGRKSKRKEKSERGGKRRTNQFERADKCNKPKVYFTAASKWVLRYCITLFM